MSTASALAVPTDVGSLSPVPAMTASSDSEKEISSTASSAMPGRAGALSPSAVCLQRRLSSAIVTTPEKQHDYIADRPTVTVVLPTLDHSSHSGMKPHTLPKAHHRRLISAPVVAASKLFLSTPAPLRLEAWTEPPGTSFKVRGPRYVRDKKKIPSEESAFRLLTVDLIKSEQAIMGGLCRHPHERIQKALQREKETGVKELPDFVFAVNLAVPGPPFYHLVCYFGLDEIETIESNDTPFGRVARKFFFGNSDQYRDDTFKLIPRIKDGNFVVKKAVGSKPAVLGRKLDQVYIRNERFFELIVDIGSDPIAHKIVKLSIGYARTLVVDMAFVLEACEEDTLPEQIMGCVRLKNIDFKKKDGKRICCIP